MAASPNNNRKNNSNILKTASLTGYAELDSKDPKAIKKRQKNIIIGGLSGIIVVFIACLLLIPMSPLSFFNPDSLWANLSKPQTVDAAELKKEEIKAAYAEQGIELNDEDLVVEVIENEDGTQTVDVKVANEDKAQQMRDAMQSVLDRISGGNPPSNRPVKDPNYNGHDNWDSDDDIKNHDPGKGDDYTTDDDGISYPGYEDPDNQDPEYPTIEEIVADANVTLRNISSYINASLASDKSAQNNSEDDFIYDYDPDDVSDPESGEDESNGEGGDGGSEEGEDSIPDDAYVEPDGDESSMSLEFTKQLLEQRLTGNPSSDTIFPVTIDDNNPATYGSMNERLNGQCFMNVDPFISEVFYTRDDYTVSTFNPFYYSYYSDKLYNNILNKELYKKEFKPNSVISVKELSGDDIYTFNYPGDTFEYEAVIEMKLSSGYKMVIGWYADKYILLDIL